MLTSEVAEVMATGKEIGFSAGHATGKIAGAIEGREEFLNSEEFATRIRETRLQGARDFQKAPAFEAVLEIKAADFLILDASLQPFVDEDTPPTGEDEFAALLDEIEDK
ncbi:UNVERIFIED_CONTAM: hypothetical protein Sindi_1259100 [Sesamum indicum]